VRKLKTILQLAIAALLVSGAAICAAAQSRAVGKQNERVQTAPAEEKKSTQEANKKQPASQPAIKQNARENASQPTGAALSSPANAVSYSYEFTQPKFFIRRILIEHDEKGHGEISFQRKDDETAIVDPVELSPAALARIKALWETLRFIDSNTVYQSDKQLPHLGTMRLGMKSGERERVAEFNWTHDANAFALVNEYKRIADQAIFVFNITLARENQPLEAPKLLDELDKLYKRNGLSDPQQLASLLTELSNDERIPLIARNHAARLLKQIQK
jgi:hypothetical protein